MPLRRAGKQPARAEPQDGGSNLAQQRFGAAKSISSAAFNSASDGPSDYEKQARLSRFQGSSAISSADYYGEGESGGGMQRRNNGGDDFDVSAGELIGKLSFQARQDLAQVRSKCISSSVSRAGGAQAVARSVRLSTVSGDSVGSPCGVFSAVFKLALCHPLPLSTLN